MQQEQPIKPGVAQRGSASGTKYEPPLLSGNVLERGLLPTPHLPGVPRPSTSNARRSTAEVVTDAPKFGLVAVRQVFYVIGLTRYPSWAICAQPAPFTKVEDTLVFIIDVIFRAETDDLVFG